MTLLAPGDRRIMREGLRVAADADSHRSKRLQLVRDAHVRHVTATFGWSLAASVPVAEPDRGRKP